MKDGDIVKINWEPDPTLDGKIGKIFLIESNGEYVHIEICDES